ncbi:TPA: helix-turn-helix domain-containing protein, partial [Staphylococcus aureus]|nr:helix-turn-helix domain-containing protein [Staphylococcus aureus]
MNNLSEIKNTIQKLLDDKSISNYRIQKDTGVSYGNISELRNKKRQLKNLTLETVEKLYNYQKGIEKMNELNNKMIEDVVLGEVELVEGLQQYFIDIEG